MHRKCTRLLERYSRRDTNFTLSECRKCLCQVGFDPRVSFKETLTVLFLISACDSKRFLSCPYHTESFFSYNIEKYPNQCKTCLYEEDRNRRIAEAKAAYEAGMSGAATARCRDDGEENCPEGLPAKKQKLER